MTMLSTRIPFPGFYYSLLSDALDREDEQLFEHIAEEPDLYDPAVVLAQHRGELGEIMWKVSDYKAMHAELSKLYAEAFVDWLGQSLDVPILEWEFEEMTSPRYYNFETDRVFIKLPLGVFEYLLGRLRADHPGAFEASVRDHFTSYDGFASFYDNDPERLLAKPLAEWDHNELYVLLEAWIGTRDLPSGLDLELYYDLGDSIYQAWSSNVDWARLDELAREWAADLDDLDEPEAARLAAPPRCQDTLELPL